MLQPAWCAAWPGDPFQPSPPCPCTLPAILPTSCRHWMHSEMWWPRLFKAHGEIAWDDYEKDYSDLPEEVLQRHRWARQLLAAAGHQPAMYTLVPLS